MILLVGQRVKQKKNMTEDLDSQLSLTKLICKFKFKKYNYLSVTSIYKCNTNNSGMVESESNIQ